MDQGQSTKCPGMPTYLSNIKEELKATTKKRQQLAATIYGCFLPGSHILLVLLLNGHTLLLLYGSLDMSY